MENDTEFQPTLSLPSVSSSGIIVRRPESTAKDRLTVYMLPFSSGVWAFLLVSIPIASLAMYLATIPRRRLNRRLLRLLSAWRGYGSVRKPSPVPSSPVKIFVTSAKCNPYPPVGCRRQLVRARFEGEGRREE
ncbi:hypothetical protein E2C01_035622 [Portunus trituberculatus]|uniref:Uncharacterized protein n=1 Tax=Portunus trituberculatus TaxID=210409 RepID=A0A5B7F3M8_PORTR|nr:hypothetical protein [Portunus trituberculatus]